MIKNYNQILTNLKAQLILLSNNKKFLKEDIKTLESYLVNILEGDIKKYLIKLINEIENNEDLNKIKLTLLILITSINNEL